MSDSASTAPTTIHLASWETRFWAWVIDVIVVGAVLSAFGEVAGTFAVGAEMLSVSTSIVGLNGLALWLYWTVLEGHNGQSAGKLVMNISVTDERGEQISYLDAAIESFGKAFLLPIDALVGWIGLEGEYVRLCNRLSATIVIEVPEEEPPADVRYVPPK